MALRNDCNIVVTFGFYVYIALFLLVLPIHWFCAWVVAVTLHETGHFVAIRLCGAKARRICFHAMKIEIETDALSTRQECICAMAGPAGSLLATMLICRFPLVGFFGALQLMYNLIPVYPSDGGRVIRCVLGECSAIPSVIERVFCVLFWVAALYFTFYLRVGLFPILAVVLIQWQRKPCKLSHKRVQ